MALKELKTVAKTAHAEEKNVMQKLIQDAENQARAATNKALADLEALKMQAKDVAEDDDWD